MFAKPQTEHHWLESLVGEWSTESECQMGPDQPPVTNTGRATARSLGGLWTIIESEGTGPDGQQWSAIMTLGYDPQRQRYLGTFVASMMTHLWLYAGTLDSTGRLVLDTEGPKFDQSGTAAYQDIVQRVDDDHWILSSQIRGDDGNWHPFMIGHHRRQK